MSSNAEAAGNAATGSTLFNTTYGCNGCHGSPPVAPQLNAANAADHVVLDYVIAQNFGGAMGGFSGLTATERDDITAYLASVVPAVTITVGYHGTSAATPLKLTLDPGTTYNAFSSVTFSTPGSGGVISGATNDHNSVQGNPVHEATAVYTHTANNCGTNVDSFTVYASGNAGNSSTRTVNVTVTCPGPPTAAAKTAAIVYNTATAIDMTSSVTNTTSIAIGTNATHGSCAVSGLTITYTPNANYSGSDSCTYTATGPGGGPTAPATLTLTVGILAGPVSMTVPTNTAGTLDLLPYITGAGITGISISAQGAHGVATVNGTNVTYTPAANYSGPDTFSYLAYGGVGTSAVAGIVTVTVTGRPDPTLDPAVIGLINAQIDAARRFTHAQIGNFTSRLESLHHSSTQKFETAGLMPNTRLSTQRTVVTGNINNNDTSLSQTSIGKANTPVTGQLETSDDRPIALVSPDPMGDDTLAAAGVPRPISYVTNVTNVTSGKAPASAVTAIQNSSVTVSQSAGSSAGANRLMGDGVRFGVRDLASQTTQQTNPVVALVAALSAANGSQSAAFGKSLTTAMNAIKNSSLNLTSSTGADDGSSDSPGGFNYWMGGGVRFGTRDQTSTSSSLDFTTDGISIGADKRINKQFVAGMGIGFGRDKTAIGTDGTNDRAHSGTVAVYGSYQPSDGTFIDGVLGYGSLRYQTDRYVAATGDFAHAERSGDHAFTSLTTGYDYRTDGFHVSPYGRLDLALDRLRQSTETGAGTYNLSYANQSSPSVTFSLGLRAETAHQMDFGWALPRMRLEFQHDFKGDQQTSVAYADLPATPYAITSTTTDRNSILFGLGSDFILRTGLRLSLDYQMQRASMHDNSQAMLFKLTKELDGKAPPSSLFAASGFSLRDWKVHADAGYTFDDNINRSSDSSEKMSDSSYNAELTKSWLVPVADHTRLVIGSALGGEKFHTYTGLDRMYLSGQVEYQYRASGNFGSPIWGIFANATREAYSSFLRDGYRYSGGVSFRKPITDRINVYSALAHNERRGKSAVFDTKENLFKANLDYAVTDTDTLYISTEYHQGDIVSSGTHTLPNIDIAKVFTLDDVFTKNDFYDYRFDGKTALLTIGYNLPFGPKDSLDVSWRSAVSAATKGPTVPSWSRKVYVDNQLSIVYLLSF